MSRGTTSLTNPLAGPTENNISSYPTSSSSPLLANPVSLPVSRKYFDTPPADKEPQSSSSSTQAPINPLLRLYDQAFEIELSIISCRWAGLDLLVRFSGTSTLAEFYPTHPFTNERTYRDFERLIKYLQKNHPTNLLPALPPIPSVAAKATERAFLLSFERYLTRLLSHPVYASDQAVVTFCVSPAAFDPPCAISDSGEGSIPPRMPSPTWSNKLKALVTSGPKDTDVEFERRKEKCAELDYCLRSLTRSAEKLANANKDLSVAFADVSIKASALGAAEYNPTLANDWHEFGKCMQVAADVAGDRAGTENAALVERVNLALKNCSHVQVALDNRLAILDAYDHACKSTEKHKQKMDKLRAGRPSEAKVSEALGKLEVIKTEENTLRAQFRTASDLLARDWPVAEEGRVSDLQEMVNLWAHIENDAERRMFGEVWSKLRASLSQAKSDVDQKIH